MTNIIKALEWRYATKKFNSIQKIPEKEMEDLLKVLQLAPSSFGLQPWKFVLVRNPELRKKLQPAAWNQPQIVDASHLIVLCTRTDMDDKYVHKFVKSIVDTRAIPIESLKGYQDMMLHSLSGMNSEARIQWNKNQVYLALGMLLEAAAFKGIDACPMEGFDPQKFDEILKLKEEHATATVLCALGYRADDDNTANLAKVRFPKKEIILEK